MRNHPADLNFEASNWSALMVPRARHHQIHKTPDCMNPDARFADSALQSTTMAKALALPFRSLLSLPSRLVLLLTLVLPISVGDTADAIAQKIHVVWGSAV